MESVVTSAVLDDREEGEIVDDDFEDISDNSIIVPIYSGKSVSSKEHLPAISLSSVTEVEEPKTEEKARRRQRSRRKSTKSYKKRRNSHRTPTYSDSDSDEYLELDKKLQRQLKAAIRVDNIEDRHRNSLRTRLRAMTKLNNDSDNSIEKIDNIDDKVDQKVSSDEGDTELNELRLEALRTAVLNKFMHRKKRKIKELQDNEILSDISVKTDTSETNKENTHGANENIQVEENCSKKICVEKSVEKVENKVEITNNIVIENNTPPEDDEDVLRALLLASMSKKITNETDSKKALPSFNNNIVKQTLPVKTSKGQPANLTVKHALQFKNRVVKNNVIIANNRAVQLPKIEPLIININADSESDDDTLNKTQQNPPDQPIVKPVDKEIENTVEKFLKEQRAKVEAQLSPIPKAPVKVNNSSVILEKSSVKLLPKVKQIEYQKLLQKLKNAERRPRVRRSSFKFNTEGKPVGVASKKIVKTKVPVNRQTNTFPKVEQLPDIRVQLRVLHKTLKEMQIQKNGRLQIQEKYKILMPIIKKITESSTERKKCDEEVKRLSQELEEAKKRLHKSQQNFSAQLQELIKEKEDIDKSSRKPKVFQDLKTHFTSTPVKDQPCLESFEASSIPTTTPNQPIRISGNINLKAADPPMKTGVENVVDAPINPGDRNNIDRICAKQKSSIPKYISPLDNAKRVVMDDPFSIICPYDVDGNCRDPECIYKHLFK